MSPSYALVNGEPTQTSCVFDRGLAFGDGVFETIRIQQGQAYLWDEHLQRLKDSLNSLSIPFQDFTQLEAEAQQLIQLAGKQETSSWQVLKIIITRGTSALGYRYPDEGKPSRYLYLVERTAPDAGIYTQGVVMRICQHRLSPQTRYAGLKHLNRLDQVTARCEWQDEAWEGLMLDQQGHVVEGTMSNIFVCCDKSLVTPRMDTCGVAGVMRQHIMRLCRQHNIPVLEKRMTLADLIAAQGVFLCNSVVGLVPVRAIASLDLTIPKLTRQIQALL